jgi:hypothetical protein
MDPLAVRKAETLRPFPLASKESCEGIEISSPKPRLLGHLLAKPLKNILRLPPQLWLEASKRESNRLTFVARLYLRRSAMIIFGLR